MYVSAELSNKRQELYLQGDVFIDKTTTVPGGLYDRRLCAADGFVKGSNSGFYFDEATNIMLRNCSVQWFSGVETSSPILLKQLKNIILRDGNLSTLPVRQHIKKPYKQKGKYFSIHPFVMYGEG